MTKEEISEKLSNVYGFRVPLDFAEVLLLAYDNSWHSDGYYSSEGIQSYFNSFLSFEGEISAVLTDSFIWLNEYREQPISRNFAFLNLPFEFFPFGEDEELGKIYGFILQDASESIAIGECSASIDSLETLRYLSLITPKSKLKIESPIKQIGRDTQSAFEFIFQRKLKIMSNFLVDNLKNLNESEQNYRFFGRKMTLNKANETMALFGKKLNQNYSESSETFQPVRQSWQFEETLDGIGVFAPTEKFWAKKERWEAPVLKQIDDELTFIRSFLQFDYPATALRIIRDNYWENSEKEGYFAQLAPLWAEIYEALNRPLLAKSVKTALEFRK